MRILKNLISTSVKASDMVPEEYAIPISENCSWQFILCNSGVNWLYKCLKSNESIKT